MLRRTLILLALLAAVAVGLYLWFGRPDEARLSEAAVTGQRPQLSLPRGQTIPTLGIAEAVGWPAGAKPTPAAGLAVSAFATGLDHPRWLYRLPNGDVLVAETNAPPREGGGIIGWITDKFKQRAGAGAASANRITLLRDTDGDGAADQRSTLLTGLNSPFGMALMGDHLYVANTDALVRFPFTPGQTKITAPAEKVIDLPAGGMHWARNVVAAPDGKSLFVSVGSASNIGEDGLEAEGSLYAGGPRSQATKGRALILQVFPGNGYERVYAWGMRNPNGMAFEPKTQALWAVVSERDLMGSDLPPDYLTQVDFGGFYGWPWNYWGGYVDKRVSPGRPDLVQYTKRPDFALGAHTTPLGLAFADDARLGEKWSSGAFVALHGSWNRQPLSGYKVVYVPFGDNGFPLPGAKPVDLLTGFLGPDGETARGRPVGVVTDAQGGLLVADDVGNVIWRVRAARR